MNEFPAELMQPKKSPENTGDSAISRLDKYSKKGAGKTLRAGVAAGAIFSAQPAFTETPQSSPLDTKENTLQQAPSPEPGIDTLERAQMRHATKQIENTIIFLKNRFQEYPHVIADKIDSLEKEKGSSEYLKGVIFLLKFNTDITSCIDRVAPEKIKDLAWLKQRLDVIPDDIREKLQITNLEFDTRDGHYNPDRYSDPDFVSVVNSFAQKNTKPSFHLVSNVLESRFFQNDPEPMIRVYAELLSNGLSHEDIVFLFLDNIQNDSLFEDRAFIDNIVALHNLGIETSIMSPVIGSENAKKISSSHFVESAKKLVNANIPITREALTALPEWELDDRAITNLVDLSNKYKNLRGHLFEMPVNLLSYDDLKETIENLQNNRDVAEPDGYHDILRALKLTTTQDKDGNPDTLEIINDISKQVSIGFNPFDGLISIEEARLADPVYFESLLSYLKKGRERSHISERNVNSIYLETTTGKDLSTFHNDIHAYFSALNQEDTPDIAKEILTSQEDIIFYNFVENMSREDSQENRLRDLEGLNTQTKFRILATVGEHGWTSTRNLIYDGYHIDEDAPERGLTLHESIQRDYGDAYTFLMETNPASEDLSNFLSLLGQMGKVDSFFELIGDDEQKNEVINKFLLGLEKSSDTHSKVAGLVEALHTLKWKGAEKFILGGIESEAKRLQELENGDSVDLSSIEQQRIKDALLWYELVAASYFSRNPQVDISEWGQDVFDKHRDQLPTFETIPENKMFPNGVHIRYHTFFNNWDQSSIRDKDGHRSLETTIKRFGGTVKFDGDGKLISASGGKSGWSIEMREEGDWRYVVMTKTDKKSGRKMINIMNSPKMTNEEIIGFYETINSNFVDKDTGARGTNGFVMRGHGIASITTTAKKIHENLVKGSGDIPYVNFGSCGGYKHAKAILEQSPTSFFLGTQGTGMADININLQMRDMEYGLANGEYDSKKLKELSDKKFSGYSQRMQEGYSSYRWPHDNGVAQVFAAFNTIKKDAE